VVLPTRSRISLTATIGLIDAVSAAGGDPEAVLRAAGVDRSILANLHGFIPCATFAHSLEVAATMTGDECFGLHFGERYPSRVWIDPRASGRSFDTGSSSRCPARRDSTTSTVLPSAST